ncbi:hypothetical protein FRC10_009412, partial [Ceratobasidium sp. 414]
EEIILRALKESLDSNGLAVFNRKFGELATSDVHLEALQSTPLELVPVLLSAGNAITDHPAELRRTLELIARYGSAKEVLLVTQESLDTLVRSTKDDDDEGSTDDGDTLRASPSEIVWKWINLIDMYTLAFPRLVLRKRSAPETAGPIVEHLRKSFDSLGILIDPNTYEGQDIVDSSIRLGYALLGWFRAVQADVGKVGEFKAASSDFMPSSASNSNTTGTNHIIGKFVILALGQGDSNLQGEARLTLGSHLPDALLCLSQPKWRHVALKWLMECVSTGLGGEEYLNGDIATDMVPAVSSVAATDPTPETRAAAFRLLTQITLKVHPEIAFGLVHQLADEACPFPNMRASAVGLLRQLVVRAFSKNPPAKDDPFAARILLQEYASILFRSYLLNGAAANAPEPADPQEINRIVESLGFYYVLLARDTENLTGVRDLEFSKEMNTKFVAPLKQKMPVWGAEAEGQGTQFVARTAEVSLERVEEFLSNLRL